jgi:mannose-6-phosphate isomerase-like protein (cupin superfamily)
MVASAGLLQSGVGHGWMGHVRCLAPDTYDRDMIEKVNLADKFALFDEQWSPKVVADLNDAYVKVVKLEGEFVWHHHDDEDELFWVVSGRLRMELRDGAVILEPGELIVVPKGVEHRPVAEQETHVVLIEPKTVLNTGNVRNERTVETLERI